MNPEVFDQSPESAVRFELRYVRAYGSKALLQIARWPMCIFADYPVQKPQRGFRKSLVKLHFMEPMLAVPEKKDARSDRCRVKELGSQPRVLIIAAGGTTIGSIRSTVQVSASWRVPKSPSSAI